MFGNATGIGVDIGTKSLRTGVANIDGELIASKVQPFVKDQTRDSLIGTIVDEINGIRHDVALKSINPICIGIAAKGFIDHQAGILHGPDQGISGWENVHLSKILGKETGLPVYVGNDANLMTIAEHRFGAARGYNNVIFVALRGGIGGGILINGKLYKGTNDSGGEIGQMIINYPDGLSEKGIKGSFEHIASASAVVRRYYEETGTLEEPGDSALSCREIFERSYRNEPAAEKVINENAEMVGVGLANLISIFDPEIIIVGGGMSEARDDYFERIRESAYANSLKNYRACTKIEKAHLGSAAALLGSVYYGLNRLAGKYI